MIQFSTEWPISWTRIPKKSPNDWNFRDYPESFVPSCKTKRKTQTIMKRLLILLLGLISCLQGWARGIEYGPWVTEARADRMTICWLSEKPGMAYVELPDGTQVWETFAGRRIFKRLHSVSIDYYTFRHGPVSFIVLDGGETGQKRSILYCGEEVYEDYLNEQIKWAREAMMEPFFSSAPMKICLIHVPMIDHPDKDDYLLQRWLAVHFFPLLDEAGIDLMISADLHEFMYCEPGSMGNPFPVLVNDDVRRLDCIYDSGRFTMTMFNTAGTSEFSKMMEIK